MDKLKEAIKLIGKDIYNLNNDQKKFLSLNKAYSLFPTFAGLQNQISRLATKSDLEELKRNVEANDTDLKGEGFPYNLAADIGTTYVDTTAKNGAYKWIKKKAGTGWKTWSILAGDTGSVRPNNIQSNLDNAYIELRRINSTVEITFGGLKWGWFGIKRRGSEGYYPQSSDKERNVTILPIGGLPSGFRPTGSKIGIMMNDKGQRYGTWYVGGNSDNNHVRLQFDDPVPTDREIGDIRFTSMSYTTDDPWPESL
jgi:hypothetical protein|nr:MAG TPA: hypothetical protein [Caudoviricetes sp.]